MWILLLSALLSFLHQVHSALRQFFFTQALIEFTDCQGSWEKAAEKPSHQRGNERERVKCCFLCQFAGERRREMLFRHLPSWDICLSHKHTNSMQMCKMNVQAVFNYTLTIAFWHLHHSDVRVIAHIHAHSQFPRSPSMWEGICGQRPPGPNCFQPHHCKLELPPLRWKQIPYQYLLTPLVLTTH